MYSNIYKCMYNMYIYIYNMIKPGGENIHSVYTHLCIMCNHYKDKYLHLSMHPKLRSSPLSTHPAKGEIS